MSIPAVIDTNVLFEGLTKKGGAAGFVIEAWLAGLFKACVSNSMAYEYLEVLSRKLSTARLKSIQPVLGELFVIANYVPIYFTWRPMSPDRGDDHLIDCAMNSGAVIVTSNIKDFRMAADSLGVPVLTPLEFLVGLANNSEEAL